MHEKSNQAQSTPGSTRASASKSRPRRPVVIVLASIAVLVLGIGAMLLLAQGGSEPGGGDGGGGGAETIAGEAAYEPRATAPGAAETLSVSGETSTDAETTLSLPDGTSVLLPPTESPVSVLVTRETNDIDLGRPGFETTGSMIVLSFSTPVEADWFTPRITVPGKDAGDVAYATLQMARVSAIFVDGEVEQEKVSFLTVTPTATGDLSAVDFLAPITAPAPVSDTVTGMQQRVFRVRYSLASFQRDFNWIEAPRLVPFEPDRTIARRHVSDTDGRGDPRAPVTNIIVLVHGHAEVEKAGYEGLEEAPAPWRAAYKRDVWTLLYEQFREQFPEQLDCTYFYEYIYPTYRPILSEVTARTSSGDTLVFPPIGDELAKLLVADPVIASQIATGQQFNLFVVAHSQGGVMARAGLQALYSGNVISTENQEFLQQSLQKIVTWGSPHHGSAIWTAGYAFRAAPEHYELVDFDQSQGFVDASFVRRTILPRLAEIAIDAPSVRDLRWDGGTRASPQPLQMDSWFVHTPRSWVASPVDEYNLQDGTWLYSRSLRAFNERDAIPRDKYAFLYGVLRTPRLAQTQVGALLNYLIFDGRLIEVDMLQAWIDESPGDSDGAVPIGSSAPDDLGGARISAGDIDHEEFFGSPATSLFRENSFQAPDQAARTFGLTFSTPAIDFTQPRCACAALALEAPRGDIVTPPETLAVRGTLTWPEELEPQPGRRLRTVEVVLPDESQDAFGTQTWPADGGNAGKVSLSAELDVSKLDPGVHRIFLRARFLDGTMLTSTIGSFEVTTPIVATATATATATSTAGSSTGYWRFKEIHTNQSAPAVAPGSSSVTVSNGIISGSFTHVPSSGDPEYTYGVECSWAWTTSDLFELKPGDVVSASLSIADTSVGTTNAPYGFISFDRPYLPYGMVGSEELRLLTIVGIPAGGASQDGQAVVPAGPGELALKVFCSNGAGGTFERVYEWVAGQ